MLIQDTDTKMMRIRIHNTDYLIFDPLPYTDLFITDTDILLIIVNLEF